MALAVTALVAGCGSDGVDGGAATTEPVDEVEPITVEVTRPAAADVTVRYETSTRVLDEGRYYAFVGSSSPHDVLDRATAIVVDLLADPIASVEVPLPGDTYFRDVWVAGGELRAVVTLCDEIADLNPDLGGELECVRGHNVVLVAPNPLLHDSPTLAWRTVLTDATGDLHTRPVFTYATSRDAYLKSEGRLHRVSFPDGQVETFDAPGGTDPYSICGDPSDPDGDLLVKLSVPFEGSAEPNRRQNWSDAVYARLTSEGEWIDLPHPEDRDMAVSVLGGRCIGTRQSMREWDTDAIWVLDPSGEWSRWGSFEVPGFEPGVPLRELQSPGIRSDEWFALEAPSRIELLGEGGARATIELAEPDLRSVRWGVILPGDRVVLVTGRGFVSTTLIR